MASKKKAEKVTTPVEAEEVKVVEEVTPVEEKPKAEKPKTEKPAKKEENAPKYKVGSIVFIAKDASADLNGFKLFPQYKKYTYTVEAYDAISGVYSLRRLNLSLKLKEADIVAPDERASDAVGRKQF